MEKGVISQEEAREIEELKKKMAARANERLNSFQLMPTLTVVNKKQDGSSNGEFNEGDFVLSTKTENGYSNKLHEKPFTGIILKVRMFFTTKFSAIEKGSDRFITDEFDSYKDDQIITVKRKTAEGNYEQVFQGNYKEIIEEYSEKGKYTTEKILDLHHAIYVLTDIENETVIRIDSKGKSRGRFFDFMNSFERSMGEYMSSTMVSFNSIVETKDWKGNMLKSPVYAIDFGKVRPLTLDELKKVDKISQEFDVQLQARDLAFGKNEELSSGQERKQLSEGVQEDPKEDIPVIQLEDQEEPAKLSLDEPEDEDEVKLEDVPF